MNEQQLPSISDVSNRQRNQEIIYIVFKTACTIVFILLFIALVYRGSTSFAVPTNFVQIRQFKPIQRIFLPNSTYLHPTTVYPNLTAVYPNLTIDYALF